MLHLMNKENSVMHHTPAPSKMSSKTPFKIPLNDENTSTLHPKTRKNMFASRDPSLFVTPVGPRRQALAGKTTNVKARSLASGAQQGKSMKNQDPALKPRSQLTISAQAEPANDVPEIEYMAPVPPELPYVPEGFEEPNYAALKKNYMKGCHRAYLAGVDQNGKTEIQRSMEKNYRRLEDDLDAETEELMNEVKGIRKPRTTTVSVRSGSIRSRRTEDAGPVRKTSDAKRSSSRTASSRSGSAASTTRPARPTSSASITRSTLSSSQRGATTQEMLSQRPDSRLNRHSRTGSVSSATSRTISSAPNRTGSVSTAPSRTGSISTAPRKPLSFPNRQTSASSVRSQSKPRSFSREVRGEVKKAAPKARVESTLEAIERIQREDEEADQVLSLPMSFVCEDDENDVVVDFPSPLRFDDDEFFMSIPE